MSRSNLLIPSGVAPGQYGDATNSAKLTIDAYGRVISATSETITGGSGGDKTEQGAYGSRSAADNDGDLYFSTDSVVLSRDKGSGNGYSHWGPLANLEPPPAVSGFTWDNQGGATATDTAGGILFTAPQNSGTSIRVLYKSAPTPPYTITAAFHLTAPGADYLRAGLCFRQASDGKIIYAALGYAGGYTVYIYKFNNSTSFSATYVNYNWQPVAGVYWLRIADNNTNRIISLSADGQNWVAVHTVGRTDFLTADQVGLVVNSNNATFGAIANFISWKEA